MERVEGFKKHNSSKTGELFQFDKWPQLNITVGFADSWANAADRVLVEFEERDRKAVADLFRKMADSLDGEELFKPGRTGRVIGIQVSEQLLESGKNNPGIKKILMLDLESAVDQALS
jgi:hypothetical protein